jgi:hypothetical protein
VKTQRERQEAAYLASLSTIKEEVVHMSLGAHPNKRKQPPGPWRINSHPWFGRALWSVTNAKTNRVLADRLVRAEAQFLADRMNYSPCAVQRFTPQKTGSRTGRARRLHSH